MPFNRALYCIKFKQYIQAHICFSGAFKTFHDVINNGNPGIVNGAVAGGQAVPSFLPFSGRPSTARFDAVPNFNENPTISSGLSALQRSHLAGVRVPSQNSFFQTPNSNQFSALSSVYDFNKQHPNFGGFAGFSTFNTGNLLSNFGPTNGCNPMSIEALTKDVRFSNLMRDLSALAYTRSKQINKAHTFPSLPAFSKEKPAV